MEAKKKKKKRYRPSPETEEYFSTRLALGGFFRVSPMATYWFSDNHLHLFRQKVFAMARLEAVGWMGHRCRLFFFLLAFGLRQIQPFQVQGPIDRSGGLNKMLIFENLPGEGRMDKEKHKKDSPR